ncbi:hypothetical protein SVIO_057950 [Streptomyces violaceusniger]|uniref:Cytochrome P450 n=1 Tax=Streptomyces violaceusniger TaxID=68280 RepID=A0A4D4L256_STRVO|nr:hypothetical protein SVIO_057950 [Streptomyces violaceusniger]
MPSRPSFLPVTPPPGGPVPRGRRRWTTSGSGRTRTGSTESCGGSTARWSRSCWRGRSGDHGCPPAGREIAEGIAATAVEVLLDRLPDVRPAVAPDEIEWRVTLVMRGVAALPVEFTPALVH